MTGLWPEDLQDSDLVAPVSILRNQAFELSRVTANILRGAVEHIRTAYHTDMGQMFSYSFSILAPMLDNYEFELFTISNPIELYPVTLDIDSEIVKELLADKEFVKSTEIYEDDDPDDTEVIANSEEEFVNILKYIFNSEKSKRIINSLKAQSKSP